MRRVHHLGSSSIRADTKSVCHAGRPSTSVHYMNSHLFQWVPCSTSFTLWWRCRKNEIFCRLPWRLQLIPGGPSSVTPCDQLKVRGPHYEKYCPKQKTFIKLHIHLFWASLNVLNSNPQCNEEGTLKSVVLYMKMPPKKVSSPCANLSNQPL